MNHKKIWRHLKYHMKNCIELLNYGVYFFKDKEKQQQQTKKLLQQPTSTLSNLLLLLGYANASRI